MTSRQPTLQLDDAQKLYAQGDIGRAIDICRSLLKASPDNVRASHFLGALLFEGGDVSGAIKQMRKTVQLAPRSTDALYNLGVALKSVGKIDDAAKQYGKVLALDPNHSSALNNLANIHSDKGDFAVALPLYERSVSLAPGNLQALYSYGVCLRDVGQHAKAFNLHLMCVRMDPGNAVFREGVTESLALVDFETADDELLRSLLDIVAHPACDVDSVAAAIISALRHTDAKPVFDNDIEGIDSAARLAARLARNALFIRLLSASVLPDPRAEAYLTKLRRALLLQPERDAAGMPMLMALACQCFLNEYVYSVSAEETAGVDGLRTKLERGETFDITDVCLFACYEPLYVLRNADDLMNASFAGEIADILRMQVREPRKEKQIAQTLPTLTAIDDETSKAVRQQYEENPYPRWLAAKFYPYPRRAEEVLRQLPLNLEGVKSFPERPDILIAGCGTGKHAIRTRSRFIHNDVLAIDLSRRSLAYAMRKAEDMDIDDIEFAQADILRLGALGRSFDIIESSGVLHHMKDPLAGWKVLAGMLKPRGFMRIALYSDIARQRIAVLRDRVAAEGLRDTADDIRSFRSSLMDRYLASDAIGNDDAQLLRFRDFYTMSDCRDLLFHVQEHRFTLPDIESHLRQLGLRFLGFEISDAKIIQDFRSKNPKPHAISSLRRWHDYELANPQTFSGMYQFWCAKDH